MFPNTQLGVLNKNKITNIKREDVNNWSESLTQLHLSHNKLTDISGISILKNLIKLNLTSNQI